VRYGGGFGSSSRNSSIDLVLVIVVVSDGRGEPDGSSKKSR